MKREQAFDLVGFLTTTAQEMHEDPSIYASLRLVMALEKFLSYYQPEAGPDAEFYQRLHGDVAANQFLVIDDQRQYGEFLDRILLTVAEYGAEAGIGAPEEG